MLKLKYIIYSYRQTDKVHPPGDVGLHVGPIQCTKHES